MGKQDLKLNFGVLDDIIGELYTFMRALEQMYEAVQGIQALLDISEGRAIEVLKTEKQRIEQKIDAYKEKVNDLYHFLQDYSSSMQAHIRPVNFQAMMRVDRQDIWHNLNQIGQSTGDPFGRIGQAKPTGASYPEEKQIEYGYEIARNRAGLEHIYTETDNLKQYLDGKVHEMKELFNQKVVHFEETDNYFANRAGALYDKYTGGWERVKDAIGTVGTGVIDIVKGAGIGIWDTVIGIFSFASSGVVLLVSSVIVCFPGAPDWAKENVDNFNKTVAAVLNDPMILVESIGQDITDRIDEDGIAYAGGYYGIQIGIDIGIARGAGKLAKVVDIVDDVGDAGRVIKVFTSLDDIIEDIARTGRMTDEHIKAILEFATHNGDSSTIVLGKYGDGGPDAYLNIARNWEPPGTYFDLGEEGWRKILNSVAGDSDEMWRINKAFLEQQINAGKEIVLSHNPWNELVKDPKSYFSDELRFLDEAGYKFIEKDGKYYAVKK